MLSYWLLTICFSARVYSVCILIAFFSGCLRYNLSLAYLSTERCLLSISSNKNPPPISCSLRLRLLFLMSSSMAQPFFHRTNSNVEKLPQIEILGSSDPSSDCSLLQPLSLQQHSPIWETPLHFHEFYLTESGRTKPSENEARDCHQLLRLKATFISLCLQTKRKKCDEP